MRYAPAHGPAPSSLGEGAAAERVGGTPLASAVLAFMAFAVPLDVLPLIGDSSVTSAIGGSLALAAAWQMISTRRVRTPPAALLWLTALAVWAAVSLLWAADLAPATSRLATVLQLLVFVWLGWQIARSRRDLCLMLGGYLTGCAVAAAGAWRSFLSGAAYVGVTQEALGDVRYGEPRFAASGYDPNDMGVTLALGIPIATYLALAGQRRWRLLWLAYLPLGLSGIVLSGSRGAALTAGVAVACVVLWAGRKSPVAAAAALALAVAAGLGAWWVDPETWRRILTFRQQLAGGSLGDRLPIWRAGLALLWSNPIAGVGVGGFPGAVSRYLTYPMVAHNTFLSVTAELGILGAAIFLGALLSTARSAWREGENARALMASVGLTWIVGVSSLTWEYRKTTWFLLLACSVLGALPRGAQRQGAP